MVRGKIVTIILRNLSLTLEHTTKSDITAFTGEAMTGGYGNSANILRLIHINTGNELVEEQTSREEKHLAVLGFLYHEIGHILFTDFPTKRAWKNQLSHGAWFPQKPQRLNTVEGINLAQNMTDPEFLKVLVSVANEVENCLEDSYIENEVRKLCPGMGANALWVLNMQHLEAAKSLKKIDPNAPQKPGQEFYDLLEQILLYAKYEEIKVDSDYDGPLLDALYECMEVVDDCKFERNPETRLSGVNELLCITSPFISKAMADAKQQQQNQNSGSGQGNQSGQSGANGQAGASQSGNQTGQPGGNGQGGNSQDSGQGQGQGQNSAAIQSILQKIAQLGRDSNTVDESDHCVSSSVFNTTENKAIDKRNGQDSQGAPPKGPGGNGGGSLNAAAREVNSLIDQLVRSAANEQAESERIADLNKEGKSMDLSDLGFTREVNVKVDRAAKVPDENIQSYDKARPEIESLSRGLQRDIRRVLKDRREGGKRKNLPFGRRLEVASIVHQDGKIFSRNKLPTETPRLGVGLLVDESGSTSGALIHAATIASLVVEDFCRNLGIPHMVYGYTSSFYGNYAQMIAYADIGEVDDGNRYRITGMSSRGGTPTASAMGYMVKRMSQLPADVRLLIVITDGQSGDNVYISKSEHLISKMIYELRRKNVIVVAAGIGKDRADVEREFGQNFMNISNIAEMPEQLVNLIKKNIVV